MRSLVVTFVLLMPCAASAVQEAQPPACTASTDCRQMALDAAAREDYETFHTLAWRAVQTGPRNDPSLLYLLARAQSLSGRPHDALVMLRRLAEMGARAMEAETSDDFRRVRSLPAWTETLETIRAGGRTASPEIGKAVDARRGPAPRSDSKVASPAASASARTSKQASYGETSPERPKGRDAGPAAPAEEIAVPSTLSRPIALDYDAVSRRFVLADDGTETLKIVDELSGSAVNLVSRGWAGAYRTAAIAIDRRRGDLWVAGADESTGEARSAVHRLQLVSGRLLYSVAVPEEAGAARFTDVALHGDSALFLDQQGRRIYELSAGSKALRLYAKLDEMNEAASIAPAGDSVIYIAHDRGIARLDRATRKSAPVRAGGQISLQGLQWIRSYNRSLLGIQKLADGSHAAVRMRLDPGGKTVRSIQIVGVAAARAAAISSDVFYYLSPSPGGAHTVRRLILR